jgi:O-methyltransferase
MTLKQLFAKLANLCGLAIVRRSTAETLVANARRLAELSQRGDAAAGRREVPAATVGSSFASTVSVVADGPEPRMLPSQPAPAARWDYAKFASTDAETDFPDAASVGGLEGLPADSHYEKGMAARQRGDDDLAFAHFGRAMGLIPRHGPSMAEMERMGAACHSVARSMADTADPLTLRDLLVRAVEMNPADAEARRRLDAVLSPYQEPDLTKMCFIFYDDTRARQIHGEAYRRALEFVTIGGVVGDVLEFGVLGGWSARLFCETMRDLRNYSRVHLFDSFEGLPDYKSEIDTTSYEIEGRNLWPDKMRLPAAFLAQFRVPHEKHIKTRLSGIIRKERIIIHKGFFSETLTDDFAMKASIVHIDCDLYQSTTEVLWGLLRMNVFQDGCVLLFDDWNCNRAHPNYGERRAFREFLDGQSRFTASSWYSYGYNGMAFILHDSQVKDVVTGASSTDAPRQPIR